MPIYEFRCQACGREFEDLVFSAAAAVACPGCSSNRVDRLISIFAARTSSGFTPSTGGSGCSGCSSHNCGSCR